MEKSAAGKSILNLLLLLLALGGGAYGLDRLGGTNTVLGKWLKDNLGAGNWGIKDALEGLFSPAANPSTAAAANPTSAGESTGAMTANTAGKPQEEPTISPEQAAARGKEAIQQAGEWIKDKARAYGPGFVDTVKRLPAYAASQASTMGYTQQPIINMAGKPTQITATPPTPNVSLAPVPEVQTTEVPQIALNLPDIPEAEPPVDNASIPVDLESQKVRGQIYTAFGPAAERQRRKAYHQEMRDMTNNALNALPPMEDPLGEDTQPQQGVDYESEIKSLEENLRFYEIMKQNEKAKASLQRKHRWFPWTKADGPSEIQYENVDFPEDKNAAPASSDSARLSLSRPESRNQAEWVSMAPPVDTNEMRNYLHPDKPKEKTVGDHLLDAVRNAPAGMTY